MDKVKMRGGSTNYYEPLINCAMQVCNETASKFMYQTFDLFNHKRLVTFTKIFQIKRFARSN